jgi:3-hydroxyisobutyrate dehydrogenase
MLGYPKDVHDMFYCPDRGIFNHLKPNSYVIDHTTSSPALAQRIASDLKEQKGIMSLDGPVSGGDVGAKNGQLVTMIGGESDAIDHCMPLLDCYSR